jgi:hypothetical protein
VTNDEQEKSSQREKDPATSAAGRSRLTVNKEPDTANQTTPSPGPSIEREDDAIYQGNRVVARVADPEVNWEAREIHFAEIYDSDYLQLAEECEFQKYRIIIQRVAFASRIDKESPEKGRVLRGVLAEILGYREQ